MALVVMTADYFIRWPLHLFSLALLTMVVTASKLNAAVLLPGVVLSTAVVAVTRKRFGLARRLIFGAILLWIAVLMLTEMLYLRQAPPSSIRVVLGFESMEYRFGMIGGPYLGSSTSSLLLVLYSLPAILCLVLLIDRRGNSVFGIRSNLEVSGLAVSSVGLFFGAFFLQIPPVGKPEIYLSSTGLMLAVLALLTFAGVNYSQLNSGRFLEKTVLAASIALTAFVSIASAAWIWSERFHNWPSTKRFLMAYASPYLTVILCIAAYLVHQKLNNQDHRPLSSQSLRCATSMLIFLLVAASVGTNLTYGVRGPLSALVDVVDSRASLNEFIEEVSKSTDQSLEYQPLIDIVERETPTSAVIISNTDLVGRLMIASEARRRMWWIEFTALANQGIEGAAISHLAWRKSLVAAFFADPREPQIRGMLRCGVTHAVIERAKISFPSDRFLLPGFTTLRYSDETHLIVEFNGPSADSDIPDVSWLKWCGV